MDTKKLEEAVNKITDVLNGRNKKTFEIKDSLSIMSDVEEQLRLEREFWSVSLKFEEKKHELFLWNSDVRSVLLERHSAEQKTVDELAERGERLFLFLQETRNSLDAVLEQIFVCIARDVVKG